VHSTLKTNGNSGCSLNMGLHPRKNDQKVNKQLNSYDTGKKEERDCAQAVCKKNHIGAGECSIPACRDFKCHLSWSEENRGYTFLKNRYFGEHLTTCLLDADC